MRADRRTIGRVALAVSAAVLFVFIGFALALVSARSGGLPGPGAMIADVTTQMQAPYSMPEESAQDAAGGEQPLDASRGMASAPGPNGAATDSLVIRSSSIALRVARVEPAIENVRAAVTRAGGEITDVRVSAGDRDPVVPLGTAQETLVGPASATITIRVPATELASLEKDIVSLGTVVTQSSSAQDVTEQAVDLNARLTNLRAEEARLRSFLDRTTKVSELLEVERELTRVRGEIEAMDAQLTYLERQTARATLTVMLSEPGPLAQPGGITWDLRQALGRGVRIAAAMITALVTVAIPLALAIVLAIVIAAPIRVLLRRRAAKRDHTEVSATEDGGPSL